MDALESDRTAHGHGIRLNPHTSLDSSPDFNPPGPPPVMLPPDDTFSLPFNNPGTFVYFCKVHAYKVGESWVGMVGIVHVVPVTSVGPLTGLAIFGGVSLGLSVLALAVAVYAVTRRKGGP